VLRLWWRGQERSLAETIYDVAIIGAGPAGYTAAIRAGQYGLKTALIEKGDRLGGTCLLVGCIPTKALLFNAEIWDHLKSAKEFGIEGVDGARLNWGAIQQRKDKIIAKHVKGLEFLMRKNKVDVVRGFARLTGAPKAGVHTLELSGGQLNRIQARNVLLATGSEAKMLPGLAASDRVLTNIEILSLGAIPKSLAIIGAGAVGVEFGSIYRSFDTEITIVEMLPRLVPVEDEEISKELARVFRKRGINTHVGAKVDKVEPTKNGMTLTFTTAEGKQEKLEAEKLLVAVGRKPNTEGIGLEQTRIQTERGFIHTNEWMQTAEPGVYAVGDIVAGFPQLAHVGSMEGLVAIAKIAGKPARPVRRDRIPGCTYTEPQIGSVGLTEAQARQSGRKIKVGKFPFTANSKATILGSHEGFIKIVADGQYGEILGVHIIGPSATELIAEAVLAMEMEATVDELMFTIHAHPTLAEAMLDAVNSVQAMAINA
jgi:dihydrolipoamide dehydrogenase